MADGPNGNGWAGKVPPWMLLLMAVGGAGAGGGNILWSQNQQVVIERLEGRVANQADLLRRIELHVTHLDDVKLDKDTSLERMNRGLEELSRLRHDLDELRQRSHTHNGGR